MSNTNNSLQLELHVSDFEKVKSFYSLLGFKVVWERRPETLKGYLVIKNESGCILNFWSGNDSIYDQSYFKNFNKNTKRGYGVEIVIPTKLKLSKLETQLKDVGTKITEPLVMQPWGREDFRCEDPFGYYLRITTPHDITDPNNAVK
jgi:hypothetical protein